MLQQSCALTVVGPACARSLRPEGWLLRDEQCCGKQGGGHRWSQRQRLARPLSTALSPHTMEKLGPGYLSVMSAPIVQPNCSVRLPFYFFPVKFLAWLMEDGEEIHPSKTASLGFAGALFQSACRPWSDYELWLFYFFQPFLHLNLQIRCQVIFFPLQYCKMGITPQPFWDLLCTARDATDSF